MKNYAEFDRKGCFSYKKIYAVTIPILLSMLMEHIIGMTDTAFLGRVSEVALGASALGTVYFLVFYVLGSGFSFGAQILIARRNGERNFSKIGSICYASGFFLLLLSVILIIFIRCFSPSILAEIIKSKDICDSTIQYMNYRAYGLFFAFGAAIFRAFYVGIARTKILTYTSIAMVGSNFVLNYALIFGKFGLPAMGIAGAATASSISEAISLLCYIVYSLKVVDVVKYGFHCLKAFCKISILKKVFAVSFWMMLQPFLSVGIWFLFFLAVEHLGERSLAVINLARSLSALPFMVIHACATAANSLTGNLIGAEKVDQVWRLIGKISLACTAIVLPMLIIFSIFPQETLRIYTDNHELIKASVNVVYVMNIASFFQIFAFILFNVVSGTGAVKTTVVIETVNLALYVFFVWLIIIRMRSTPAVAWTVEIIYQLTASIICFAYLFTGRWKNKKL
ncbi:MAG: MATE family efflux transporter [Lentisphaeria bacterium]|nr:MATE family efflux transporter [Lentisphaeria bacterium]